MVLRDGERDRLRRLQLLDMEWSHGGERHMGWGMGVWGRKGREEHSSRE